VLRELAPTDTEAKAAQAFCRSALAALVKKKAKAAAAAAPADGGPGGTDDDAAMHEVRARRLTPTDRPSN
jgi:hypothetical protein